MTGLLPMRSVTLLSVLSLAHWGAALGHDAMFRGGPTHEGVYASTSPTLGSVVWKFKTGGFVLSSPAVSGDWVYVGSSDGRLYASTGPDTCIIQGSRQA